VGKREPTRVPAHLSETHSGRPSPHALGGSGRTRRLLVGCRIDAEGVRAVGRERGLGDRRWVRGSGVYVSPGPLNRVVKAQRPGSRAVSQGGLRVVIARVVRATAAHRFQPAPSGLVEVDLPGHHGRVRKAMLFVGATVVGAALLVWAHRALGPQSGWFAFVVVWLSMTWLGTVSHLLTPRLPGTYHELRGFERNGRIYELVGVRLVKALLRRGPLAVFNPDLHLPTDPRSENLARLDQRMRDAEASHFILLVVLFGVAVHAAVRGWWLAATLTALFDLLVNGYPVMLQRYNRALLQRRYADTVL